MKYIIYYFTIMTGVCIFITARNLIHALTSKNWVKTKGKVIESCLEESAATGSGGRLYKPCIKYQYVFGVQTYENNNVNF
ncbi:MAG: DUF3592 domain-containing protein [Desulfobacula sp.]|nr:DUF3592 domain-containing protein [Desulfobacula sp.]MCD4719845.1 DUF3592 domain-containing protein [Desulfobacula sp.]